MNDISVTITQGGTPPVTIQSPADNPVQITGGEVINLAIGSGPPGPQGPMGPAGVSTLAGCTDVQVSNVQAGDLLRYDNGKWRNRPEQDVLDAGNF